jgi:molybdopterin converting factor small subunit
MRVTIPSPLLSYTGRREVEASGTTVDELLHDLDRQFPGLRFRMIDEQGRIRPHMRIFIGADESRDLASRPPAGGTVHIVQALSGG